MDTTKPTPAADPAAARRRRTARRAFLILGIIAGTAVAGYLAYGWWTKGKISDDNAEVDGDVVYVSPRIGGYVASVSVSENQEVNVGDPLFDLDTRDLQLKRDQAQADLDAANAALQAADAQIEVVKANAGGGQSSAQASVTESSAGVRTASAQVAVAQAAVDQATTMLARRKADLDRDQKLADAGAIPANTLDQTRTAYDSARSMLDAAKAQLEMARENRSLASAKVGEAKGKAQQSTTVDAQVDAAVAAQSGARAKVASAQVAFDTADQQVKYAHVTAPIAGIVTRKSVAVGQNMTASVPALAIVSKDTYVIANLKESEIEDVHHGQAVDVDVDAYPGKTFHGEVDTVSPATGARFSLLPPDNATGNFVKVVQRVPVKITWTRVPDGVVLRPGLSAEVVIHVDQ